MFACLPAVRGSALEMEHGIPAAATDLINITDPAGHHCLAQGPARAAALRGKPAGSGMGLSGGL